MLISKANIIAQLQKDILLMQGFKPACNDTNSAGLNLIKHSFPNNTFPLNATHEFFCSGLEEIASSSGFIAGIVSSLIKTGAPSVWISSSKNIFPPALKQFGIDAHKIIFINSPNPKQILWTVEEALKCNALSAVIAEINEISFTESRRLQLAVEQTNVSGFLIRNNPKNLATACVTRWKIKSLSTGKETTLPGLNFPKWNVELLKVRNGKPGSWSMQWRKGKFELLQTSAFIVEGRERKIV